MGEVGFNSEKLTNISENFLNKQEKSISIHEQISGSINVIKENWTGDAENLAGRDRDFADIEKNLTIIDNNMGTIAKFLSEKNDDFSQVTYK